MRKLLAIAFCAVVRLSAGAMSDVHATPSRSQPCGNCHDLDPAVTVTVSLVRCTGSDAEYQISVSDTYSNAEGWAIFDNGANIRHAYGDGVFTVPGNLTYDAWGVSDGSGRGGSDVVTIGPDCGGPTCNDNDGDGFFAEEGCGTPVDCDDNDMAVNPGVAEDCTDGIDNDCDGLIDDADTDCGGCVPTARKEKGRRCADGVDNDCDGATDLDDSDCVKGGVRTEICDDGIDNDDDGKIDCQDKRDCGRTPVCRNAG